VPGITTAFPVVPLTGSLTIGIGVMSYIDQLNVTVVADRDRCPDLEIFIQALNRSMSELSRQHRRIERPNSVVQPDVDPS
jgi:hypothetical protein